MSAIIVDPLLVVLSKIPSEQMSISTRGYKKATSAHLK